MIENLTVHFLGEKYVVIPRLGFAFGRDADLAIDRENPYMHRVVGSFYASGGDWWLYNAARHIPIATVGGDGRKRTMPAGTAEPLVTATGAIRFRSGPSSYELEWEMPTGLPAQPPSGLLMSGRTVTADFGTPPLTNEQFMLILAMAEPRLRHPGTTARLPTNGELAAKFGWSLKQFDRRLDYLCRKLTRAGVAGLHGSPGGEAANRREVLVRHYLDHGIVSIDDLPMLDEV